jgi:hypothetical protein
MNQTPSFVNLSKLSLSNVTTSEGADASESAVVASRQTTNARDLPPCMWMQDDESKQFKKS